MKIQHNLMALNCNRQCGIVRGELAKSTEKLSSGYKINRAADDAAGLSISEKMRKQIRGLKQGVANSEDGISLCQVADGALNEVHDMLQRINELSVKAANETNSFSDRQNIQDEIDSLVKEIDRVGETTKFNEIYIFHGEGEKDIVMSRKPAPSNSTITISTPTFGKMSLDCKLNEGPFNARSSGNHLGLSAMSIDNNTSERWRLVFGDGSTSNPAIQGEYNLSGTVQKFRVELASVRPVSYSAVQVGDDKAWSRSFLIKDANGLDMVMKQTLTLHPKGADSQYYTIQYDLQNNSAFDVKCDVIHHEDTAYSNRDTVESYFTDAGKVTNNCIYTSSATIKNGTTNTNVYDTGIPSSLSIVNEDGALSFTESILTGDADTLVIGHYYHIGALQKYTDTTLATVLGGSTNHEDLGFSLVWSGRNIATNGNMSISFKQGIIALEKDTNMPPTITKAPTVTVPAPDIVVKKTLKAGNQNVWLQSGCEQWDGIAMKIGAMNAGVLDIDTLNVTTTKGADDAISRISTAISELSRQRSRIGSYQNRIEHTIANENNVIENTTAAESQIRDADMATEMVKYANNNVIMQAGQSMLSQANQTNQGVLQLIA